MLNDQPTRNDLLGRRPFADSIARIIAHQSDPASQVIAIDGAWGEGKTTVFGFLKDALISEDLKVMEFNPWRHRDEDAMIRAFALGLAEKLGVKILNKTEEWIETSQDRTEWLKEAASVFGAERIGNFFHFGTKRLRSSVEQLLDRVKSELNMYAHRVTILVDDPDRLDVGQLLGLFRLIKLIANYEWLTFVLAMDCDAVARTVGQRFGGENEGKLFLEKIVQVPIRLPAIPHSKLRGFTLELINSVLQDLKVDLKQTEVDRFRGAFDSALMPLIQTPRTAKQYANVLRFALGLLPGEVNPVDVMLLEGIRIFLPDTFQRICKHLVVMDDLMTNKEELSRRLLGAIFPEEGKEAGADLARSMLFMLFQGQLSGVDQTENQLLEWTDHQRVAYDEYFLRYLAAVVPDNDVADTETEEILAKADRGDIDLVISALKPNLTLKTETIMVQKLRRKERCLNDQQRRTLAEAVAMISDCLTFRDKAWQGDTAFGQAAFFVSDCIRDLNSVEEREGVASSILSKASSSVWTIDLFYALPHFRDRETSDHKGDKIRYLFSKVTSQNLGAILAKRLMSEIEGSTHCPATEFLYHALSLCIKHGEKEAVKKWVQNQLTTDAVFLATFSALLMSWLYGDHGRHYEWPGDDNLLKKIPDYIDAAWLVANFSPLQPPERTRQNFDITPDEAAYRIINLLKTQSPSITQAP